jgi:hypothetical protein
MPTAETIIRPPLPADPAAEELGEIPQPGVGVAPAAAGATCSGSISVTVPTPVVPGSGTGSYRGISGVFDMTVTIDEVDTLPVCDGTRGFLSQLILVMGPGDVAFR